MPFIVEATDRPNSAELRERVRPAHIAYLEANLDRLIAAGAKLDDAGVTATGSIYILATDSREEAEAFVAGDPFVTEGVLGDIVATRWRKAIFDHQSFIPKS